MGVDKNWKGFSSFLFTKTLKKAKEWTENNAMDDLRDSWKVLDSGNIRDSYVRLPLVYFAFGI